MELTIDDSRLTIERTGEKSSTVNRHSSILPESPGIASIDTRSINPLLLDKPQTVYISAGSNLGDRRANLEHALSSLAKAGITLKKVSSIFETEPVGYLDQPWFLNIALEVETLCPPEALLECCQLIELSKGRDRPFHGAPRTLDLDILLYGNLVLSGPRLIIPHPRMADRKFVLKPLCQIASQVLHPVLKRTIHTLLESCRDPSSVYLYPPGGSA